MTERKKGIWLLVSIVERGQAAGLMRLYREQGICWHYQSYGRGTASSELLDILGMGGSEREIILSLASAAVMRRLMEQLKEDVPVRAKGIAFSTALTAVTGSLGAALRGQAGDYGENGREENGRETDASRPGQAELSEKGDGRMEREDNGSLILVMVNQGYTDEVMNTARAAGARGGTIIRSRFAGGSSESDLYGFARQEEKEIIAIVAMPGSRNVILETIHKIHGPQTEAGAVVCSVALEQMVRLG